MAKRRKISRSKKLIKVLRRKWFKPGLATLCVAFLIYFSISNLVKQTRVVPTQAPHFLISRLSDTFEPTEFTHLLLTVQEINKIPGAATELKQFANMPYPSPCPDFLKQHLNHMNWEPQAFLIRVKKIFALHDTYDRLQRLDQTIAFLAGEVSEKRLPLRIREQIKILRAERDKIKASELSAAEYQFIDDNAGLISQLREE